MSSKKLYCLLAGLAVLAIAFLIFDSYYLGCRATINEQVSDISESEKANAGLPSNNLSSDELIRQNEIVMLLLGVGVLIFAIRNRVGLNRLPAPAILMTAFYILLVTWLATVLEDFRGEGTIWNTFFNVLEHAGLAASSVLTAIWCWKAFTGKKKAG